MLHLVLRGKATYKEQLFFFERTTYDALVRRGVYFLKWRERGLGEARSASGNQSVKDAVAEVGEAVERGPRSYFLVRGIATDETVFRGDLEGPRSDSLYLVPGDLLVLDPRPDHPLFHVFPAVPREKRGE